MNVSRTAAENLAIAIAQSYWSVDEIEVAAQSVFRKRQSWLAELAADLRQDFIDRPRFSVLLESIATNPKFLQAIALRKTKKAHQARAFPFRHTRWLDWNLPVFRDTAELASHLGIRGTTLHWLTSLHLAADDRPHHYVARWIKKRSGQPRLIESPKSQMKATQRLILQDVLNRIPLHRAAHGFRRKRNVLTFTSQHVDRACCLRMDLKDFFPSVRASRVQGLFRSFGFTQEVARCLTALTTTQTHQSVVDQQRPRGSRGAFEISKLYLTGHLPQGAPTSPAIANVVAFRLDARLTSLAESANVRYTRYADDLLFSGDPTFSRQAKRFSATVGSIAIEEGFEVNFRKTQIQKRGQRQHAAGIILNEHPNVRREDYDRLKAVLFNCVRHGPADQNRDGVEHFAEHLQGRVDWIRQVNPQRAKKLQDLFDEIDWN
jgi:hypothetical protein